jgi:hypothetical protein
MEFFDKMKLKNMRLKGRDIPFKFLGGRGHWSTETRYSIEDLLLDGSKEQSLSANV